MRLPILGRPRPLSPEAKTALVETAVKVARDPRLLGEVPQADRNRVDELAKAIGVGASIPRPMSIRAASRPIAAQVVAQRAAAALAPSSNITPVDIAAAMQAQGLGMVQPFSPGEPLTPFYGYGRRPRNYDYQIARNTTTQTRPNRIPFETLKQLYDSYDVAQTCTRHSINDMRSMRIRFEAMDGWEQNPAKEIAAAKAFWRRPDGKRTFKNWLAQNMLDLWRYDSAPIYRMRNRAGNLIALKNISAPTIAPILDYFGDFPESPAPAFQQFIEGIPWNWLTWDDLIYEPFWPETESPYGTPPLETVLINANTDIRLQMYFLQFFTTGQVPEAFATAPEGMTDPDALAELQEDWNAWTYGDQSERWGLRWLPSGTELNFYKPQTFDPDLAEYVERRTVAAYGLTPQDLGILADVNRSTSETQVDQQFRITSLPTVGYYEDIIDAVTQDDLGLPVQIRFDTGREKEDRLMEAQAHQIYVQMGAESVSDVTEKILGLPVDPAERVPKFYDSLKLGPVPMSYIYSVAGDVDPVSGLPKPGSFELRDFVIPGATTNQGGVDETAVPSTRPKGQPRKGQPQDREPRPGSAASKEANAEQPGSSPNPEDEPGYGLGELEDLRKWRAAARKQVKRGATPKPFLDSSITDATFQRVWPSLCKATTREQVDAAFAKAAEPGFAGLALRAADTGRVLMLQRAQTDGDPAGGTWEFPGGHVDPGETCREGAVREWEEETGCKFPDTAVPTDEWDSHNGIYRGHVYETPSESDIDLYDRDNTTNPDGDDFEAVAWWDPADLSNMPALRPELKADIASAQHATLASVLKAGDARPKAM